MDSSGPDANPDEVVISRDGLSIAFDRTSGKVLWLRVDLADDEDGTPDTPIDDLEELLRRALGVSVPLRLIRPKRED